MTEWAPILPVAAMGLVLACESPTPPTGMPSEPHTIAARDRVLGFSVAELPTLGGAIAGAIAINPAGATSGFSDLPDPDLDVVRQPVIWSSGGGLNGLSTPGDGGSAIDINAAGDAVGIILRGTSVTTAAFWPADGSVVDLGGLGHFRRAGYQRIPGRGRVSAVGRRRPRPLPVAPGDRPRAPPHTRRRLVPRHWGERARANRRRIPRCGRRSACRYMDRNGQTGGPRRSRRFVHECDCDQRHR